MRDIWEVTPNLSMRIEAVHRLSSSGAVSSYMASGTSSEGVDAEWKMILLLTVKGDRINRCEIFDEADRDTALTRFEELQSQASHPHNAASGAAQRFLACFAARDWAAMANMLVDRYSTDDRRRTVNAGIRYGRDAAMDDFRAGADVGFMTGASVVVATRGERLALTRARYSVRDASPDAFQTEMLHVIEIDGDDLITGAAIFDLDDLIAAFQELEARYLAGEAAAHAHTWSVITGIYTTFNRHELPAVDWALIDHRRGTPFGSTTWPQPFIPSSIWRRSLRSASKPCIGSTISGLSSPTIPMGSRLTAWTSNGA